MFCKNCGVKLNAGASFCKNCGEKIVLPSRITATKNKFLFWLKKKRGIVLAALVGGIVLVVIIGLFSGETPYSSSISISPSVQREITSSVVNIFCPSTISEEEASGGSGTIISDDGWILTNSHIIPQDGESLYVDESGCLVVLPDPVTGQPDEVFWADPIVIPGLSDDYDLAFMEIYAAYYDDEEGSYWGTYPRKFPAFDDTLRCRNEDVQLGEPIRIFGYPAIAGGYSLTITDGVVSSFPGEGLIITSAKISSGNSGGLAVDRRGCMIGIPSMVSTDEHESLGVIISTNLIYEFLDILEAMVDDFDY